MGKLTRKVARLRLPSRNRKFIAVDFDSRHLRIVQAQHTAGGIRVLKLTQVDMPEEMDISNPLAVGTFLGRTLKELRLTSGGVLMSIPRGQAVLKPLTLPPGTDRDELANMVRFQVEKELPYDVAEAVIDYTITSHFDVGASQEGAPAGVNVLAAVAKQPVVDHYRRIAAAANVKLLRLGLRPYACLRCADACTLRGEDEAVAVVFLTADETEINVVVGRSLTFSRSAVVSITPPRGGSDPAIKETVDSLVTEIARSLQSYQTVHGGGKVDAVLLAGSSGVESRVAQRLSKQMAVRCETFDPSGALGLRDSSPETSAFIAAIGLAIAHAGPAMPFDFLAPKRPRVRRNMRKVRIYAGAAAGALALLLGVLLIHDRLAARDQHLESLQAECNKLKKEAKVVAAMGRYVKEIQGWRDGQRDWLDHWANLCGQFPSCQYAYIDRFKTNRSDGSVVFSVKATENPCIDRLRADLTRAGYEVRRGTSVSADTDEEEYRHKTELKIIVPKDMRVNLGSIQAQPRPGDDIAVEKFRPGEKLPSTGSAGTGAAGGTDVVYAPPKPAAGGTDTARPAAAPPAMAGLTPREQEWRREFDRRMDKYWQRDLERRRKNHKGPVPEAVLAEWRREFDRRMEPYWQKELRRRRGGSPRSSGGSDRPRSYDPRRRRGDGR